MKLKCIAVVTIGKNKCAAISILELSQKRDGCFNTN